MLKITGNDYHRFWAKVICELGGKRCWTWQGARWPHGPDGYGQFMWEGHCQNATRVVWFFTYGEWPQSDVLHDCDNPPCVRIDHLHMGNAALNGREKIERGRHNPPIGERARHAILSGDQVLKIRSLRAQGVKLRILAETYGVAISTIQAACNGQSWKHLG